MHIVFSFLPIISSHNLIIILCICLLYYTENSKIICVFPWMVLGK